MSLDGDRCPLECNDENEPEVWASEGPELLPLEYASGKSCNGKSVSVVDWGYGGSSCGVKELPYDVDDNATKPGEVKL